MTARPKFPRLSWIGRHALATVAVLALATPPLAAAASDPVAQGIALRKAGDDQGALPLFQKGYEATHAPRAAAQLGLCEQALGRWMEAETHVTEALKASDDPWVNRNRGTLDSALVVIKSHIGRLEITGEPAGATVSINGIEAGKLPLSEPVRVAAGEVQIEIAAPGYTPASRTLHIDGGGYQRVALRAQREPAAAAPPVTPPAPDTGAGSGDTSSTAAATVSTQPSELADQPVWRKPVRWVSLGLGAASLGLGVFELLHNRSIVDNNFDPSCWRTASGSTVPKNGSTTQQQCDDWKSSYEKASTLSWVGFIGAGVFTAAGVILWATDPHPGPVETALRACTVTPVPGNLSLGCAVRF